MDKEEIRIKCLQAAVKFYTEHHTTRTLPGNVILTARKFEKWILDTC